MINNTYDQLTWEQKIEALARQAQPKYLAIKSEMEQLRAETKDLCIPVAFAVLAKNDDIKNAHFILDTYTDKLKAIQDLDLATVFSDAARVVRGPNKFGIAELIINTCGMCEGAIKKLGLANSLAIALEIIQDSVKSHSYADDSSDMEDNHPAGNEENFIEILNSSNTIKPYNIAYLVLKTYGKDENALKNLRVVDLFDKYIAEFDASIEIARLILDTCGLCNNAIKIFGLANKLKISVRTLNSAAVNIVIDTYLKDPVALQILEISKLLEFAKQNLARIEYLSKKESANPEDINTCKQIIITLNKANDYQKNILAVKEQANKLL